MALFSSIVLVVLAALPLQSPADTPQRQPLFKIERNTNANYIQYDAQLGADGRLHANEPVVAYWVRMAEQGQIRKLNWIQRKFAYGFDADLDRAADRVELEMAADIGRPIMVSRNGDEYLATTQIAGNPSRIEKIFIHATGKGMSTKVDYIELHGTDLETGEESYERFVP